VEASPTLSGLSDLQSDDTICILGSPSGGRILQYSYVVSGNVALDYANSRKTYPSHKRNDVDQDAHGEVPFICRGLVHFMNHCFLGPRIPTKAIWEHRRLHSDLWPGTEVSNEVILLAAKTAGLVEYRHPEDQWIRLRKRGTIANVKPMQTNGSQSLSPQRTPHVAMKKWPHSKLSKPLIAKPITPIPVSLPPKSLAKKMSFSKPDGPVTLGSPESLIRWQGFAQYISKLHRGGTKALKWSWFGTERKARPHLYAELPAKVGEVMILAERLGLVSNTKKRHLDWVTLNLSVSGRLLKDKIVFAGLVDFLQQEGGEATWFDIGRNRSAYPYCYPRPLCRLAVMLAEAQEAGLVKLGGKNKSRWASLVHMT
jgi:hypothetical protein